MNITVLKKCLDELSKDNPRLEYAKGILETFIDLNTHTVALQNDVTEKVKELVRTESVSDEEDVPPFLRPGPTGAIKG